MIVFAAVLVGTGAAASAGCFPPFRRGGSKGPTVQLRLEATDSVNPDRAGQSHSVVVNLYQLSSRARFDGAAAAQLLRDESAALGDELIGKLTPVTVVPAGSQSVTLSLDKGTRFLGVTADFFMRDATGWRQAVPVKSGTKRVRIEVRGRQLVVQ